MERDDMADSVLPPDYFEALSAAIKAESDRGLVILAAAWIDSLLEIKFRKEFAKGSAKARESLFAAGGAFSSFSAKLNAAFCAGWIDSDVYHDANIIRKLRNDFAHKLKPAPLTDGKVCENLQGLRVPGRQYHDWHSLAAAATDDGIVIYTGGKPSHAKEKLNIPGNLSLRLAIPWIVAVLIANLGVFFTPDEEGGLASIALPEHMEYHDDTE